MPAAQGLRTDWTPPEPPGTDGLPWRYREFFATYFAGDTPAGESEETEPIYNVPIIRNGTVETHIRFFQIAIRDRFDQWLNRLSRYKPIVESIFAQFDLPTDLVFLSLVESGFNPQAYSRARATGPWQFMKSTAKLYGLRVDEHVDERRDPIKSSVAAATGIAYQELKRLNPELRRDVTPPYDVEYLLKVPVGSVLTVERALDRLPSWKQPAPLLTKGRASQKSSLRWYEVRTGDSLWLIAKRFKISVQELKARNRLTVRTLKPGDRLLIGP